MTSVVAISFLLGALLNVVCSGSYPFENEVSEAGMSRPGLARQGSEESSVSQVVKADNQRVVPKFAFLVHIERIFDDLLYVCPLFPRLFALVRDVA